MFIMKHALKEIRLTAKNNGLTFKQSNTKLNGGYLWRLTDRNSGEIIVDNYCFWSAYNDYQNGFIDSWNGSKFEGVNNEDI